MKSITFFILINLYSFLYYSQNSITKSLIEGADDICTNFTESQTVASKKLSLAHAQIIKNNEDTLLSYYYLIVGKLKINQQKLDSAFYYTNLSKTEAETTRNQPLSIKALMQLGNIDFKQGKFNKAITSFYNALKIAEANNYISRVAGLNKNIGLCYLKLNQLQKTQEYYDKALSQFIKLNDSTQLSAMYINMGSLAYEQKNIDKALNYYQRSLKIASARNDSANIALLLVNIGGIYIDSKKDSLLGLHFFIRAIHLYERLELLSNSTYLYQNVGNMYMYRNKLDSSEYFLNKALLNAQSANDIYNLKEVYESLANLYTRKRDYERAISLIKLSKNYSDSVFNLEFVEKIAEVESKYKAEKKDLQLAKVRAEIKNTKQTSFIKTIIIIGCILLGVLLVIIFIVRLNYIRKQHKIKLESELIIHSKQKELDIINAEEKERIRIAADLHDNMGAFATSMLSQIDIIEITNNSRSLSELRSDAENIMSTLRETIWILKTKTISAQQFFELIKVYANKNLEKNLGIIVNYSEDLSTINYLSPSISLNLYRIIQEIIQNIVKHAKATNVHFMLHSNGRIILQIKDNGVGFNLGNLERKSGLDNIEFRANEINFSILITTELGKGTIVRLEQKQKNTPK